MIRTLLVAFIFSLFCSPTLAQEPSEPEASTEFAPTDDADLTPVDELGLSDLFRLELNFERTEAASFLSGETGGFDVGVLGSGEGQGGQGACTEDGAGVFFRDEVWSPDGVPSF